MVGMGVGLVMGFRVVLHGDDLFFSWLMFLFCWEDQVGPGGPDLGQQATAPLQCP